MLTVVQILGLSYNSGLSIKILYVLKVVSMLPWGFSVNVKKGIVSNNVFKIKLLNIYIIINYKILC